MVDVCDAFPGAASKRKKMCSHGEPKTQASQCDIYNSRLCSLCWACTRANNLIRLVYDTTASLASGQYTALNSCVRHAESVTFDSMK